MRAPANSLALSAVKWDVFATLTVRVECSRDVLWRKIELWLARCFRSCNINFRSNAYYCVRFERGEVGGRLHAHCLLRVPNFARGFFIVSKGRVPACAKWWKHGLTTFRPVYDADPAIGYMQKLTTTSGADSYELSKTNCAVDVVLSPALINRGMRQQSALGATLQAAECQLATLSGLYSEVGRGAAMSSEEHRFGVPARGDNASHLDL